MQSDPDIIEIPPKIHAHIILACLRDNNTERALECYEFLKNNGHPILPEVYTTLVREMSIEDEIKSINTMLFSHQQIVKLAKDGQIGKAKSLFREARAQEGMPPLPEANHALSRGRVNYQWREMTNHRRREARAKEDPKDENRDDDDADEFTPDYDATNSPLEVVAQQ